MAAELFITFGTVALAFGGIGLALVLLSTMGENIERRRSEEARRVWVEKYGQSGRR